MEFYSVVKKDEIVKFAGKGMDLENIVLSEVTQTQINATCSPYMCTHNTKF